MPAPLYYIKLRIAPASENPRFWDLDSGWIYMCLFASDEDEARARAEQFASVSRWEVRKVEKVLQIGAGRQKDPMAAHLVEEAMEMGFAYEVDGIPAGLDPACQPANLPSVENG